MVDDNNSENMDKTKALVQSGLKEINEKSLAKAGGKTLLERYADLFKRVDETQFTVKKLNVNEVVMGTIIEAVIKNSINFPDNYQITLKANNVYRLKPSGVPEDIEVDDSELIIEEKREIIYCAKSACTQILRALKVPEPEKGYNLKTLSEAKVNPLAKLSGKKYSLKYLGLKEFNTKQFHSYVFAIF